jgi:hypothetical protein
LLAYFNPDASVLLVGTYPNVQPQRGKPAILPVSALSSMQRTLPPGTDNNGVAGNPPSATSTPTANPSPIRAGCNFFARPRIGAIAHAATSRWSRCSPTLGELASQVSLDAGAD